VAQQRQQRLADANYAAYFIIMDGLSAPPNAQYCKLIRDGYKLTMPVLYDPTGKMPAAFGYKASQANDRSLVLRHGAVLALMQQHADQAAIDDLLDSLLTSP